MTEARIVTPFIRGIEWILNDSLNPNVPKKTSGAQIYFENTQVGKGLSVIINPFLADLKLPDEIYKFEGPDLDAVIAAAGSNVAEAWELSLNSMTNLFDVLKDPTQQEIEAGAKYYIRLDAWRALFDPYNMGSTVVAVLGCYKNKVGDVYSGISGYIELQFMDNYLKNQRNSTLANLQSQIDFANATLANEQSSDSEKSWATGIKPGLELEKARLNSQYVADLSDLISIQDVKNSVGALIIGVMSVLKATNTSYEDMNIQTFMTRFSAKFESIV